MQEIVALSRKSEPALVKLLESSRNAEPFRGKPAGTWLVRRVDWRPDGPIIIRITAKWTRSRLVEAAFPLRSFPPESDSVRYAEDDG
ncbi:MAG TPA: hypothetical protein VNC50_03415 [Planctomycetia bacterium]|nr:hypothetical protein [Planctomycetia bacterium]